MIRIVERYGGDYEVIKVHAVTEQNGGQTVIREDPETLGWVQPRHWKRGRVYVGRRSDGLGGLEAGRTVCTTLDAARDWVAAPRTPAYE